LAQNGSFFGENELEAAMQITENGQIEWDKVFDSYSGPSDEIAKYRQYLTERGFDTRLIILLYTKDLELLNLLGWDLPEGITQGDLDYMMGLGSKKDKNGYNPRDPD
jgi:hypothetical protein